MSIDEKISASGIKLPVAPERGGVYAPVKEFAGNLAYVSGCGPNTAEAQFAGRLGWDVSFEDGRRAAEGCILNVLAVLKRDLGSLDRIARMVKMTVFVASDNEFFQQPQVANAASELLVKLFGEDAGCPSRSAVGVNVLPGNIPVEIELLVELKN